MPTLSRFSVVAVTAMLALPLAACGEKTLNSGDAENFLKDQSTKNGTPLKTISCPDDIKAKQGESFDCDYVLENGSKGTITVHQTNDSGHIEVNPTDIHPQQ